MLRFKQGDLAIYAVAGDPSMHGEVGTVVEIVGVGPYPAGYTWRGHTLEHPNDYLIQWPDPDYIGAVLDHQLQRLDWRDEPASLTRHSEEAVPA
jgi:hypothetical protein